MPACCLSASTPPATVREARTPRLGTGPVNVAAGATLSFSNNGLNIPNNITLNGTTTHGALVGAIATGPQSDTLSGTLTLDATSNVTTFWSDKTLTITGQVTGPGGLIIDNYNTGSQPGGNIVLSNPANNYQGGTTVVANLAGQANAILYAGAANVIPSTGDLTVNGEFNLNSFSQTVGGLLGSGSITGSGGSPVLTVTPSGTDTFSGVISDPVSLAMDGAGTEILSGANTYTGTTTVTSGTLRIGSGGQIVGDGVSVASGAILTVASGGSIASGTNLTANGTVNFNNAAPTIATLGGSGTVNVNATTLTVSGGGSFAGTLALAANSNLTVSAGSNTLTVSGAQASPAPTASKSIPERSHST